MSERTTKIVSVLLELTFHGDYINVSYGSDGVANVAWTDMREFRPAENGFAQYIYFARK